MQVLLYSRFVKFSTITSPKMETSTVINRIDDIVKSDEDKRNYRGIELNNKMKILLVSDPTTDKSAAAMDVKIGLIIYIVL